MTAERMDELADVELTELFVEMKRIVTEAEERAVAGDILPALSSLAALPLIHRMVSGRCAQELSGGTPDDEERMGCYL